MLVLLSLCAYNLPIKKIYDPLSNLYMESMKNLKENEKTKPIKSDKKHIK